jgi:hypothetical protein
MLTNSRIRASINLICSSLILLKLFSFFNKDITFFFFVFWSIPFAIFMYMGNKLSIKSFQGFSFILLIYFLSASLRVFGIKPLINDLLEIKLIIILFLVCIFSPKSIKNNM